MSSHQQGDSRQQQGLRMKRLDKYGNYDLFYDCRHILP